MSKEILSVRKAQLQVIPEGTWVWFAELGEDVVLSKEDLAKAMELDRNWYVEVGTDYLLCVDMDEMGLIQAEQLDVLIGGNVGC